MPTPRTPTSQPAKPVMDEWGVYDPQQAGLSALFARLDPGAERPKTPDAPAPKAAKEEPREPKRPTLGDAS